MEEKRESLDTLAAALAYAFGIEKPRLAAAPNAMLTRYLDEKLQGKKADRLFLYNPDAIGQWIAEKYAYFLREVAERTEIRVPFETVMPSVTPVCFGTFYTGVQPEIHGIRCYEKPVIKVDSLFDSAIRAGKRAAILGSEKCSLSHIFLEREMDYYPLKGVDEINAKAAELILKDEYDLLVVYNGNYDSVMHKFGPESPEALGELRSNARAFSQFDEMIRTHWKRHTTLLGFAMDHGCHEIDGGCGSHGLDMPEDLQICHYYRVQLPE